jgi:P27 family predicted phage terminase small subunit
LRTGVVRPFALPPVLKVLVRVFLGMGLSCMEMIDGTGQIVPEPDWTQVFSDVLEVHAAAGHWRVITTELKSRTLLSAGNVHALQRLVMAYVVVDRASQELAEHGAVTKPKRNNPKAIIRVSPHFMVWKEASNHAAMLESEFGLSPRRRSGATAAQGNLKPQKASDAYLKRVK